MNTNTTVVALASPPGGAGRHIIRLSGQSAANCAAKLFALPTGTPFPSEAWRTRTRIEGKLTLDRLAIPCAAYIMPGPRSYTREDVIEFHFPGSPALANMALAACIASGAGLAARGEFTWRAFVNGRLDLSRAEAVERMITATSQAEQQAALAQAGGALAKRITEWRNRLVDFAARIEGSLDFEEDEFEPINADECVRELSILKDDISQALGAAQRSAPARGSIPVLAAGLTNAGKSSLINALLGREAAVVSPERSTTRDRLDFTLRLEPFEFLLQDSPGLDAAASELARLASGKGRAEAEQAGAILLVMDCTQAEDLIPEYVANSAFAHIIPVLNKCDLLADKSARHSAKNRFMADAMRLASLSSTQPLFVSAVTGEGLHELRQRLIELAMADIDAAGAPAALSQRIAGELSQAALALEQAARIAPTGRLELLAEELRLALRSLAHCAGEGYAEEVLESIFSRFCIGK